MTIIIEIEAIIKSIEQRYTKSGGNIPNKSLDVINTLEMANGEIRELYRLLTKSMRLNQVTELDNLRLMQENEQLNNRLTALESVIKQTTE